MLGEIRPHTLIPSSLQLVVIELEANALGQAEAIARMLAEVDIPERLSREHPDRNQALAVREHVRPLLNFIQKRDVSNALTQARAALASLNDAEKD